MTKLHRVRSIDARVRIFDGSPRIDCHREALYSPGQDALYDRHDRVVVQSAYMRNGRSELIGSSLIAPVLDGHPTLYAGDVPVFYIGPLRQHYGHFLLSTFSRLWFLLGGDRPARFKLLTHGDPAALVANNAYIGQLLAFLGVGADDLIAFDEPVRLATVFVPEPSFEEGHFAYTVFREMGAACGDTGPGRGDRVVYLTKTGLARGLSRIQNEGELVEALRKRMPLDVFDPSEMGVREQIDALREARMLIGGMGSHFHSALFLPPTAMTLMCNTSAVPANQVLIDRICGHKSTYLYSPTLVDVGNDGSFETNYRLLDIDDIADQLVEVVAASEGAPHAVPTTRGSRILSHDKPCEQSSSYTPGLARSRSDEARQAVSGFLTGCYQIHTAADLAPWWEVDLGDICDVDEICVFNRLDSASDRLRAFALAGSLDHTDWTTLYQTETAPADCYPFRWTTPTPVRARFVRLTLLTHDFLHLDQVMVFGRRSDRSTDDLD